MNTTGAIARFLRGQGTKTITVSAEKSSDLNKKNLTYHWVVLQDLNTNIKVTPKNSSKSVVDVEVKHFHRFLDKNTGRYSSRLDLACFVHNGKYFSAPAFVSFYSFYNEARTYDQQGKILEIGYGACSNPIEIGKDLISSKGSIKDWPGFLEYLIQSKTGNFPDQFFAEKMKPEEKDYLSKNLKALKEKSLAIKSMEKQGKELTKKIKALKGKPEAKNMKKDISKNKSDVKRLQTEYSEIILKENGGKSVKSIVLGLINNLKDDPQFFIKNQPLFQGKLKSKMKGKGIKGILSKLEGITLFQKSAEGYQLKPVIKGDSPLNKRLTNYEKSLLASLNLQILNLLYPKYLSFTYKENYVDPWITSRKSWWRDVYHYDNAGKMTGWTRYGKSGIKKYQANGTINGKKVSYKVEGNGSKRKNAPKFLIPITP